MDIRLFQNNPSEREAWNAFVRDNAAATSDHLWEWRRVLAETFGFRKAYYFAAVEDGQIRGILPLFRIPTGWGRCALTSIPYGNYGGICADSPEAEDLLLQSARDLFRREKAQYLELKHRSQLKREILQQPHSTHSRFFLPLGKDPEMHFKELGQNNRSKIRRAERAGLRTEISRDVDAMYPIYAHTARRQGTPCFPKKYFTEIFAALGGQIEILFVLQEDQPIAYYSMHYFKETLICQFSSSYSFAYKNYPNEFLFWSAIRHGIAKGYRELDFCRSRNGSGTAEFKRKLRYHEEPLDYQYLLREGRAFSLRSPANSKYQLAIRAWQKLPLSFANFLGPKLVRYFA